MRRQLHHLLGPKLAQPIRTANRILRRATRDVFQPSPYPAAHTLRLQRYALPGRATFFGYYDLSPFNQDGDRLLAGAARPSSDAAPAEPLQVGFFDVGCPASFQPIGESLTWNWQQGCRLRWHPTEKAAVLYNTMVGGEPGAVLVDVASKRTVQQYRRALYDVHPDGQSGLSLDFARLHRLRPGYGYRAENTQTGEGIWHVDLQSGAIELLLPLDRLLQLEPFPSMTGAEHYLNHISYSPSGKRFLVIHLWLRAGERHSRLLTVRRDGNDARVLSNEGHMSHYTWRSDDELLVFSTHRDTGTGYHLYSATGGARRVFGPGVLTEDGHPSFRPGSGRELLTDTYPDRFGDRKLLLYSPEQGLRVLGRFYSPPAFSGGAARCDLHPRWDHTGSMICVDSAHAGGRAMYVLPMNRES